MDSIKSVTYAVQYVLREGGQIMYEFECEYPLNHAPVIPSVGEEFNHSKMDYIISRVNHCLFQEGEQGNYRHRVFVMAEAKTS